MVTVQAFLTGLFYRFKIEDKEVQVQFTHLYGEVIGIILKAPSEELRIALFRKLFAHIRVSVKALTAVKLRDGKISPEFMSIAEPLAQFAQKMVEQVISSSPNSYQSFRQIVNHAFIDDVACDIGQFVSDFKISKSLRSKIRATAQLKISLNDYNCSQGTCLSVRDVLYPPVKFEL